MKTTLITILAPLAAVTPAWATTAADTVSNGLLFYLFIGFGALVIVSQLLPGLMLLCGMVKGLFIATAAGKSVTGVR